MTTAGLTGHRTVLSTPHGTLGTGRGNSKNPLPYKAFNSTRYIRNLWLVKERVVPTELSTPHGTLGTGISQTSPMFLPSFQLHTVHQEPIIHRVWWSSTDDFQLHTVHQERWCLWDFWQNTCLSTPHGTLGTGVSKQCDPCSQELSTPHGTLGTEKNSSCGGRDQGFQLHTVHQEQSICGNTIIKCSLLSTPHGALGTYHIYYEGVKLITPNFQLHTVHQEQLVSYVVVGSRKNLLSTPHGALGTDRKSSLSHPLARCLSTPHGALGTSSPSQAKSQAIVLSTPHGALGTNKDIVDSITKLFIAFNSTRCIRNK